MKANDIAEKQLDLGMTSMQPQFEGVEPLEEEGIEIFSENRERGAYMSVDELTLDKVIELEIT